MATERKGNDRKKIVWFVTFISLFVVLIFGLLTFGFLQQAARNKALAWPTFGASPAAEGSATPPPKPSATPASEASFTPAPLATPRSRSESQQQQQQQSPTLASRDTLPAFFPPKATSTADLRAILKTIYQRFDAWQGKGPTMRQLDSFLTAVLEDDEYNDISHFWLEGQSNPGFALVTRIEFIDDVGMPVPYHRFDTELPPLSWFKGWEFLKALVLPNNGRYRLIAMVVSQKPLLEKKEEMTRTEMEEINHGPSGLSDRDWADMEVTPDYFFITYVYEFYRKTRSDPISFQGSSDIQAQKHLASIKFEQDVCDELNILR
jgi:hypothetical protein